MNFRTLVTVLALTFVSISAKASFLYWTAGEKALATGANAVRAYVDGVNDSMYLTVRETGEESALITDNNKAYTFDLTKGNVDYSSTDYSQYSYVIELGNYDNGNFTGTHVAKVTYADAVSNHLINPGNISTNINSAMALWSQQAYAVPEPTGALLVLIGAAMLGLKRRKV